jgi:hypothetical protein
MVPSPARVTSCRLVTSYAGFENESTLLQELYKRGLNQPLIGTDLHGGDSLLMYWTHDPVAPWQNERWLMDMRRQLPPNQYLRMIENRFVTTEAAFITPEMWDDITTLAGTPQYNPLVPIWIGIDASTKRDSTAIVCVTHSKKTGVVSLARHYIFQPSPSDPLDFEATIERTIRDLRQHFSIRKILYDPFQMAATAQRLTRENLPLEEFPQTSANLSAMSQNLYELIRSRHCRSIPMPRCDLPPRVASRSRRRAACASPKKKPRTRLMRSLRWAWRHSGPCKVAVNMDTTVATMHGRMNPITTRHHYRSPIAARPAMAAIGGAAARRHSQGQRSIPMPGWPKRFGGAATSMTPHRETLRELRRHIIAAAFTLGHVRCRAGGAVCPMISLSDYQMQQIRAAAALLPVATRDAFLRSIANRLVEANPITDADLGNAIEFVLSCRGVSIPHHQVRQRACARRQS